MSEFTSRGPQSVQITKLDSVPAPQATPQQAPMVQPNVGFPQQANSYPEASRFAPVPVVEVTDSDSDSSSTSTDSFGDDYSDSDSSDTSSDSEGSSVDEAKANSGSLEGGAKRDFDAETSSSVSTTEILSRDPLFLVLSEFLMDEQTGNNIVHVGSGIVEVLNKINSKLGRIADALEKKQKKKQHSRD